MNVQDIYPVDKDKLISWLSVQENVWSIEISMIVVSAKKNK
jgi:hypothetical protein